MTSTPILVGYDGSEGAQAAMRWALDEAARDGKPVTLAYALDRHAVAAPIAAPAVWPDAQARRDAEALLAKAVEEAREINPRILVDVEVLDGSAASSLQEESRRAYLLVLGSRGHGGFAELLVGSTAIAVCAHAHCPVVVVRGTESRPQARSGQIVVGMDGSPYAVLAIDFAFEQAAARGAPLHVVRAWAPPGLRWRPADADLEEVTPAEETALAELLAGWREKYPQVAVSTEVVAGNAARALVDATQHAQLVVVGSRGRGGFRGLLLGSVSQQLVHHSHCPVAVVREVARHSPEPSDV